MERRGKNERKHEGAHRCSTHRHVEVAIEHKVVRIEVEGISLGRERGLDDDVTRQLLHSDKRMHVVRQ